MPGCRWLTLLTLLSTELHILAAPQVPFSYQRDHDWDIETGAKTDSTAQFIFDNVAALLQHWPNTRYRNGKLSARQCISHLWNRFPKAIPSFQGLSQPERISTMDDPMNTYRRSRNGLRLTQNILCYFVILLAGISLCRPSDLSKCSILMVAARRKQTAARWTRKISFCGEELILRRPTLTANVSDDFVSGETPLVLMVI